MKLCVVSIAPEELVSCNTALQNGYVLLQFYLLLILCQQLENSG